MDAYLERVGWPPAPSRSRTTRRSRVQGAHVRTVPFETLAIVGDPHPDHATDGPGGIEDEGVVLDTQHLHEKVLERERGGYCHELNALFHSLLAALEYDVDRVAARLVGSDGEDTPPANHHSNVVHLTGGSSSRRTASPSPRPTSTARSTTGTPYRTRPRA